MAEAISARGRRARRSFFRNETRLVQSGSPGPGSLRSRTGDDVIGILQARAVRVSQQAGLPEQGDGR